MYISEEQVRGALRYEDLIPALRTAFVDFSAGKVEQPARMILRAGNAEGAKNGWFAVMPVIHEDMMAVKTVTFYPGNADLGLHTHMAIVELLSRATGEPLAVLDGRLITEMRTASVSAVAFAAIAPLHFGAAPTSLGIFGSGVQARAHLAAFRHVWPELRDVRAWSPTHVHLEKLAEETGARATGPEEAAEADVVLTATSATQPVLQGRWLKPSALVLAVGATGASVRELDDDVVRSSYLVAESRASAERESGDVVLSEAKVELELGELLARPQEIAIPRNGRVLFKSVGMAIEDLAAARLVWQSLQR